MSAIAEVNSLEEASAVIANMRKMSSSRERQGGTVQGVSTLQDFQRIVKISCEEVRREAEGKLRIESAIIFGGPVPHSVTATTHGESTSSKLTQEDFRTSLIARVNDSPIRLIEKSKERTCREARLDDDDEWSDDEAGDVISYHAEDVIVNSYYDVDEEAGLTIEPLSTNTVFLKKVSTMTGKPSPDGRRKGKPSTTGDDDAVLTYGEDDDDFDGSYGFDSKWASEIKFNKSKPSKAAQRLNDARNKATSITIESKSVVIQNKEMMTSDKKTLKTNSLASVSSIVSCRTIFSNTSTLSGSVLSINPGQRIRIKPPGRRKNS